MPLLIVRDDITHVPAEAWVNSANPLPLVGAGVDSAIYEAAGSQVLHERQRIGRIEVGHAASTSGGNSLARFIIHTVGPLWNGGANGELESLRRCYTNSLQIAYAKGCGSVAFPLISTGVYGFPKEKALSIATSEITKFLKNHDMLVYLVVFDKEAFQLSKARYYSIRSYIDNEYAEEANASEMRYATGFLEETLPTPRSSNLFLDAHGEENTCVRRAEQKAHPAPSQRMKQLEPLAPSRHLEQPPILTPSASASQEPRRRAIRHREQSPHPTPAHSFEHAAYPLPGQQSLADAVSRIEDSFSESLFKLIDDKGMNDPDVYKRANIDRKLFSKIRSNPSYQPSKATALALAVALELNLDETKDLLARAGYALSRSSKFDVIVEYFIRNRIYNIFEINEALFAFDQPIIGR